MAQSVSIPLPATHKRYISAYFGLAVPHYYALVLQHDDEEDICEL